MSPALMQKSRKNMMKASGKCTKAFGKNALVSFKDHVLVGSAFQAEYSRKFVGQSTAENSCGRTKWR